MDEHELHEIIKLAGGANFDPYEKQRKEAEKIRRSNDTGSSPFRIARASAKQTTKQTQQPLYGDFWRTGELAVLTGQSGVGKSLLATQIAEVIARGAQASINGMPTVEKPHRVIYFDFERTPEQFSRLYSCRPYPNPKYVEEYKFSDRFRLARLDICTDIPDAFNGNPDRYVRHWVFDTIAEPSHENAADVFIIDNIAHLSVGTTVEKVMRALRTAASMSGASLLVIANAKPKRRPSEITIADLTRCRSLREIPDTIFALSRSTLHPDIRYVKDLKSRTTQLTADLPATLQALVSDQADSDLSLTAHNSPLTTSSAVLSYRIERLASPISSSSQFPITNHQSPFLGLNYLGLALESKHLPTPRVSSPHVSKGSRRLPSARSALINGMIDGSYGKYLLGE
jgi:hypothetical protein